MIQPNFSQRQALGSNDPFVICDIELVNASGDTCGYVKYVRMGTTIKDTLDIVIYETIKTQYPLSRVDYKQCNTSQKRADFKTYKRYKRLYLACKNYTSWDPAYMVGAIDSGLAIFLDVYRATRSYVVNEGESFLRIGAHDFSNACNEEYSNFATYREFFQ